MLDDVGLAGIVNVDLEQDDDITSHFRSSVLRERIVEHIFIGEALRRLWQLKLLDVEVLRSEFDANGYDLVMSFGKIVRHIQLKTVLTDGTAAGAKVSLKLAGKPSGCVLWIVVTPDLHFDSYLWFGGYPGEGLPDILNLPVAKHTKANALGVKSDRPNHRIIPRRRFETLGRWTWSWNVCSVV